MTIKEAPLRDALARTGPIKLPENPIIAGILSIFLCAFFSGFAVFLFVMLFSYHPIELFFVSFIAALWGATFGLGIHISILLSLIYNRTNLVLKLYYFMGAIIGYILFIIVIHIILLTMESFYNIDSYYMIFM